MTENKENKEVNIIDVTLTKATKKKKNFTGFYTEVNPLTRGLTINISFLTKGLTYCVRLWNSDGFMISAPAYESRGPVRALPRNIVWCSWARYFILADSQCLTPPRSINGYKKIECWGYPFDRFASHPVGVSGRSRDTPCRFSLQKRGKTSAGMMGLYTITKSMRAL